MARYDRESAVRLLKGWLWWAVKIIAIAFAVWQLYTAVMGERPPQIQRMAHLGFVLTLVYLLYPPRFKWRDRFNWFDLPALAGVAVTSYHRSTTATMLRLLTPGRHDNRRAHTLVLEAARRVVGFPSSVLIVCLRHLLRKEHARLPQHRGHRLTPGDSRHTTEGIIGIPRRVVHVHLLSSCSSVPREDRYRTILHRSGQRGGRRSARRPGESRGVHFGSRRHRVRKLRGQHRG